MTHQIGKSVGLILCLCLANHVLFAAEPTLAEKKADIAVQEATENAAKKSKEYDDALKALSEARKAKNNPTATNKSELEKTFQNAEKAVLKAEHEWSDAHLAKAASIAKKDEIAKAGTDAGDLAKEKVLRYMDLNTQESEKEFSKRAIRDLGLAITSGLSYVPGQGKFVPNVLVRYNFFQHRADVARRAHLKYKDAGPGHTENATQNFLENEGKSVTNYTARMVPAVSMLAGYGFTDVSYRTKTGGTKPFIVGGSIGLMNAKEASSAFHIDGGWMILEGGNLKKDGQFFVGFSLDLLHAKDFAKYLLSITDK